MPKTKVVQASFRIVRFRPRHIKEISRFREEQFSTPPHEIEPALLKANFQEMIEQTSKHPDGKIFVAVIENKPVEVIVGMPLAFTAGLTPDKLKRLYQDKKAYYFPTQCVDQKWQGIGIGKRLTEIATAFARKKGYEIGMGKAQHVNKKQQNNLRKRGYIPGSYSTKSEQLLIQYLQTRKRNTKPTGIA